MQRQKLTRNRSNERIVPPSAAQSRAGNAQGDQIIRFLENAHKGEKKAESSIKEWFKNNIPNFEYEHRVDSGSPDGFAEGWILLELKGKKNG